VFGVLAVAGKSTETRGGESRVMSSDSGVYSSLHSGSTSLLVGGRPRVVSSWSVPSARASGSQLVGGGTGYAVAGAAVSTGDGGDPPRRPSDLDCVAVKLGKQSVDDDVWNRRASMAFDSAKGLLNPVGENNCFLNSAVQVCQCHLDSRPATVCWRRRTTAAVGDCKHFLNS